MGIKFRGAVALALILASSTALAQDKFDSPSGTVRIFTPNAGSERKFVAVGNRIIDLDSEYASIRKEVGDLFLIELDSGGSACPATFVWLDTTPSKVRLSDTFGTCSDLAIISSTRELVTVTMPSFNASEGEVAFDYDGKTIERRLVGLKKSGVSPDNPKGWVGRYVYDYLTAAENEGSLVSLMGWTVLNDVRNSGVVGSPMLRDGDWIVGSGCRPHACDTDYVALGINLRTGKPVIAFHKGGESPHFWGKFDGALPTEVRQVLTEQSD